MGEIAITTSRGGFSTQFIKIADLDELTARQIFKVAVIEPVLVIEL